MSPRQSPKAGTMGPQSPGRFIADTSTTSVSSSPLCNLKFNAPPPVMASSTHDQQPNVSYSEDDGDGSNEPGSSQQAGVKRGTRGMYPRCSRERLTSLKSRLACDRCRKIKSKCEPGATDNKCKNCEVANTRACSTLRTLKSTAHIQADYSMYLPRYVIASSAKRTWSLNPHRAELQAWPAEGLHSFHRAAMASSRMHPCDYHGVPPRPGHHQ